jgi:hypothetical protein
LVSFRLGVNRLAVLAAHENDQRVVEEACAATLAEFDLLEPFVRIREALQEARSAAQGRAASATPRMMQPSTPTRAAG